MSKASEKVKEEFVALIPPTAYFLVMLSLIALIRALMLRGTGLAASTPLQIAIGALIMGKAVLLADLLPLINRYPDKPLAYNIAWKTMIYVTVSLLIHYLERVIDFWKHSDGFLAANRNLFDQIIWPHFWAIQIVLTILILVYCTFHELARVFGRDKVMAMFFGTPPKPQHTV